MELPQFQWIELLQLRQFHREVTCAVQLVSRLDRWVMGRNQDGWTTGRAPKPTSLWLIWLFQKWPWRLAIHGHPVCLEYIIYILCHYVYTIISIFLSFYLSIYPSIYPSIYLSNQTINQSIKQTNQSIQSIYLSVCLSDYLSNCLSVYLSICLSVYLILSYPILSYSILFYSIPFYSIYSI
jgi:hypothetical protein